ncbi:MAG: hypothetical protein IKQ84_05060, partial [Spirochaetaceae bacterium]|nr:hypothetical protein [Spirochaetaceae bacterium]
VLRRMAERNHNRLKLPIVSARFIGKIPNRGQLQDMDFMEGFVRKMGWKSFEEMREAKAVLSEKYSGLEKSRVDKMERIAYLEDLLDLYKDYEPYKKVNSEYYSLKGFAQWNFKRNNETALNTFKMYQSAIKDRIKEPDKKIVPKKWRTELEALKKELNGSRQEYSNTVWELACIETLEHNRKDLQRMIDNESKVQPARRRNQNFSERQKQIYSFYRI